MAAPRILIRDLPTAVGYTGEEYIPVDQLTKTMKMKTMDLVAVSTTNLNAHVNDVDSAHAASAVSAAPNSAPLIGVTVQDQLNQAATAIADLIARVTALETP